MKHSVLAAAFATLLALAWHDAAWADAAAFHASDADGSGSLDPGEFAGLVGRMAAKGRRIALYIQRTGLYGVAFGRVDRNGDGLATPQELIAAEAWIQAYAARHDAEQAAAVQGARGTRPRN